jgi:hypothetical protein
MMSISVQQLTTSTRLRSRLVALAFAALILPGASANASSTVLIFGQLNNNDVVVAHDNGLGQTTLSTNSVLNADGGTVSVPVEITSFLGTPFPNGFLAYETFFGVHSVGSASTSHGQIFENFSGKIEFTSGIGGTGANFLTAVFSPVNVATSPTGVNGGVGTQDASLQAGQPPDNLVLTSDFATFVAPTGLSISFVNVSPTLSMAGDGSIASFTAQNSGLASASFTSFVPEPGTLYLASMAVAFGSLVYGKKRLTAGT